MGAVFLEVTADLPSNAMGHEISVPGRPHTKKRAKYYLIGNWGHFQVKVITRSGKYEAGEVFT